jgi:hypothetical protein
LEENLAAVEDARLRHQRQQDALHMQAQLQHGFGGGQSDDNIDSEVCTCIFYIIYYPRLNNLHSLIFFYKNIISLLCECHLLKLSCLCY